MTPYERGSWRFETTPSSRPASWVLQGMRSVSSVLMLVAGLLAAVAAAAPSALAIIADPASSVNPFVGTEGGGETVPGAATPFGMVQWSPETTVGDHSHTPEPGGYSYDASRIRGFSLAHLSGTGCAGASGDIPFFPLVGSVSSSPSLDAGDNTYAANFNHESETATAGAYSVALASGVRVDLTASTRTGSGRFTYPAGKKATMLVRTSDSEVGSSADSTTIDTNARTISGDVTSGNFCGYINAVDRRSYYTVHFIAVFDAPFSTIGSWHGKTVTRGGHSATGGMGYGPDGFPETGKGSGGWVTFDTSVSRTVNVRVAISYVDAAGAAANLGAENPPDSTFDNQRQHAHDAWNTTLHHIDIATNNAQLASTFYTALYHSLLHPNVFMTSTATTSAWMKRSTALPQVSTPSTLTSLGGTSTGTNYSWLRCSTRTLVPTSLNRYSIKPTRTEACGIAGPTTRAEPT